MNALPAKTVAPRRAAKAQIGAEIASTANGRDITQPWVMGLRQPKDPRLLGAVDWGVYDRILEDDQVFSTLQQRRRAVIAHTWSVVAGDETDPRSVDAAENFSNTVDRIGWDRITDFMLYAIFNGISAAEVMWEPRGNFLDIAAIRVRHARRFRFDGEGRLRLLTSVGGLGEIMPDRKFWIFTIGGSNDDELYGRGLGEWLYWPTLFKRNGIRFWNIFLDKFGTPTSVGKFRPGTPKADQEKLLAALQAIATDSGVVIPQGMEIALLEAVRSGTGDYDKLVRYMDEAIAKIVLSQTMTTQDGSSLSQAQVHAGVKLEVVKADADLLSDSFNNSVARWWTDLNYGPDVASPRLMREIEEEADTKAQAETDEALERLGWVRTEESFRDTYGEGYERKAAASPDEGEEVEVEDPDGGEADDTPRPDPNVNDTNASFAADDPRPLYVYRPLQQESAAELLAWAVEQGFRSLRPANSLHVTIAYSKRPVNWMKMGGFWGWGPDTSDHLVPIGGPRIVDRIGEEGVVALHFFSGHLEQRNREMRDRGASWDYPDYMAHITFADGDDGVDLSQVKPFRGELRFGAEIFEPIEADWTPDDDEASFAEEPAVPDSATDKLVDELIAEDGYRAVRALTQPMLDAIRAARSPQDLLAVLGVGPGDAAPIGADIESAGLAAALDAGEDQNA